MLLKNASSFSFINTITDRRMCRTIALERQYVITGTPEQLEIRASRIKRYKEHILI